MRLVARVALLACGLVAARCSTGQTEPAVPSPASWLRDCSIDGVFEPARCGTVRVPESSQSPAGRQIDVRVIVLPSHGTSPDAAPVVPLVGGPGQGAADLARPLSQRFAAFRDAHDLVFIDQRGSGASNGLHCPRPASTLDLMGRIFEPAHLAACREALSARADLTRYTTAEAAADYERVLDALGYRQVNLVGTSYGSRMALELARRFPQRIRAIALDGVVPGAFDWPSQGAADADRALNAVVEDCRADRACAEAFPALPQDIARAFAGVSRAPVTVAVRDPATAATSRVPFGTSDFAYSIRGLLYGDDAASLPLLLHLAAEGNYGAFAQAYVTRARTLDRQIARGLHLSVYCAEDLPFVDDARAETAAAGTHLGTYLLTQYRHACEAWPRAPIPPAFREPVDVLVPTLLMSGRRDPVTPPRTAEHAARTLPRSRVVIWNYGGHGTDGLVGDDCKTTILREFLASADLDRLPIACMTQGRMQPFRLFPAPQ